MKTNFCLLLFLGMALLSCSSDESLKVGKSEQVHERIRTNPVCVSHAITGNWNWTESVGGIAGMTLTPQSTGENILLKITATKIKKYVNGQLTETLPYVLETHASIYGGEREMIVFDGPFAPRQSYQRKGNNLTLLDECYDCYVSQYLRQ